VSLLLLKGIQLKSKWVVITVTNLDPCLKPVGLQGRSLVNPLPLITIM
jgi:hypothetical protein